MLNGNGRGANGLCVETLLVISSSRGKGKRIKKFLSERRRETKMKSIHFWCTVTNLGISVRGRQLQLPCERGKPDKTFRSNCKAFQ